jgi:hypothetical protein
MAAVREQRIRQPPRKFSLSDDFIHPTHHLLYFDATDSFKIAMNSSIKKTSSNTASVMTHGKKTVATIVTSGNYMKCVQICLFL